MEPLADSALKASEIEVEGSPIPDQVDRTDSPFPRDLYDCLSNRTIRTILNHPLFLAFRLLSVLGIFWVERDEITEHSVGCWRIDGESCGLTVS